MQPLPDLERRLRALESQRIETGLTRIVRMAKTVGFLLGGFAVGVIALVLSAERLAPPAGESGQSVSIPMTRRNIVVMLLALGGPIALGGALSLASYRKLRRAGSRDEYERRFAEEVAVPLARAALPGATADAPTTLPLARLESSMMLPRTIRPDWSRQRLRVSWTSDGIAAEAIACRLIEQHSIQSEQSQRLRVLHDGLIAWFPLRNRWPTPFVVAEARAYPQARRLGLRVAEVEDARFRRTAPFLDDSTEWMGLLTGPAGWEAMSKDPGEWRGYMVFGDDASAAARAASAPVRDAVVQVGERLGVPFMLRFSPEGVVLRVDGAGRFAPASNEEELAERLGDSGGAGTIASQVERLEGDARLLAALPEVGRLLSGV